MSFFESAFIYLSDGQVDLRKLTSTNARMNAIATWLKNRKYLFILDGFEVMQHQTGDKYGEIKNNDMRQFLQFFARVDHTSFCLITSRVPLVDLEHYITYQPRDVNRLSQEDGRTLLKKIGVKGSDKDINQLVDMWDGHALTLSLLGSDIVERYGGDIPPITELPVPEKNEGHYERISRILHRYDKHLTKIEQNFMIIFSAFRIPVFNSVHPPDLTKSREME